MRAMVEAAATYEQMARAHRVEKARGPGNEGNDPHAARVMPDGARGSAVAARQHERQEHRKGDERPPAGCAEALNM